MKINQPQKLLLILVTCFQVVNMQAQQFSNVPKNEFGIALSSFIYQGDLAEERFGSFKTTRWGGTFFFNRILSAAFSTRTNLAIGGLRGDEAVYENPEYRRQRNFNFRTPVFEISQLAVWNPLQNNYEDHGFSPYLFGGAGLSILKIRRDWSNYNGEYFNEVSDMSSRLAADTQQALPRVIPVIPLGAGIRYNISPSVAFMVEGAYRVTFTDYLDGFSKAANPDRKDNFYTISAGLIFRTGKKNTLNCPAVRY